MDLSSRLRAIVRSGPARPPRELTYEPEPPGGVGPIDVGRVAEMLGGRSLTTPFGSCLVVDRRYESSRWHGDIRIGDCELRDCNGLRVLDPLLAGDQLGAPPRAFFIDLETTGLSGGAGTLAFLVGVGYFDLGAFQVRQFLLTGHGSERALLAAVTELFDEADLIVTFNGKTFDVPVMETRWVFHRMELPLEGVPHFDMLHPARRLWKLRAGDDDGEGGCRLSTLERALFDVRRVGDVPGAEIPSRFYRFLRTGDPRPLEPVLEHNRIDLVSLAAVTARGVALALGGAEACRDGAESLGLGRVYERSSRLDRIEPCYRRAIGADSPEVRAEGLYRLGLRLRRDRRYEEAAGIWADVLALTRTARGPVFEQLRRFASEALSIHHEHRGRDYAAARELAMFALDDLGSEAWRRKEGLRHRLARLERKLARDAAPSGLFRE
jgi:tetratricopeptide (TPR) repeat protein